MKRRNEWKREDSTYRNMMSRCNNPKATGYSFYGGRGITVCLEWSSFEGFLNDMGPRPLGTSLDRIDYNRGYSKENCRWAKWEEQANNRSDNVLLSFNGVTQTISQWAREVGLKINTLQYRLYRGWSLEDALNPDGRVLLKRCKLSAQQLEYMFAQLKNHRTQTSLAKELNIDSSQISRLYKSFNETQERKGK